MDQILIILLAIITASVISWLLLSNKTAQLKEKVASLSSLNETQQSSISRLETEIQNFIQEKETLNNSLGKSKESLAMMTQARDSLTDQLEKIEKGNEELQARLEQKHQEYSSINASFSALKAEQAERDNSFEKQLQNLEEQKQLLKKEFENLAHKIFEEKGKSFSQTSQTSLDALLKPFKEQIDGFQKRINDIHTESVKGQTNLEAEIKKVLDVGLKMHDEASNLTAALKGDSQQRGAWGEAQLERTLQMSGLIEEAHYTAQESYKDKDGKTKRTDYIIKLPDGKCLIIDSKMTLPDYDRAVAAETEEEAALAMKAHVSCCEEAY